MVKLFVDHVSPNYTILRELILMLFELAQSRLFCIHIENTTLICSAKVFFVKWENDAENLKKYAQIWPLSTGRRLTLWHRWKRCLSWWRWVSWAPAWTAHCLTATVTGWSCTRWETLLFFFSVPCFSPVVTPLFITYLGFSETLPFRVWSPWGLQPAVESHQ